MLIEKVVNNNVVVSRDNENQELVLMGKGIGFHRKRGDLIDEKKVEKRFTLVNSQQVDHFSELIRTITKDNLKVSLEIIEYAQSKLRKKLSPVIYISLTDHINFAIQRSKDGLNFESPFEQDVRMFYSTEFEIGEYALQLIKSRVRVVLPSNEATSIALHIINAEYDVSMKTTLKITELISTSSRIIKEKLGISLDPTSIDYIRFVTHLKFLCMRIFTNKMLADNFDDLAEVIMLKYEDEYNIAIEIANHIKIHYDKELNSAELIFLTVHVGRLKYSANKEQENA